MLSHLGPVLHDAILVFSLLHQPWDPSLCQKSGLDIASEQLSDSCTPNNDQNLSERMLTTGVNLFKGYPIHRNTMHKKHTFNLHLLDSWGSIVRLTIRIGYKLPLSSEALLSTSASSMSYPLKLMTATIAF